MKIYRVRHKKYRHGPYTTGEMKTEKLKVLAQDLNYDHSDENHPTSSQENIYAKVEVWFSGFSSIDQLWDWFEGWLTRLEKNGYEVAIYDVPMDSIKLGKKQVAFIKPKRCQKTISLKELTK